MMGLDEDITVANSIPDVEKSFSFPPTDATLQRHCHVTQSAHISTHSVTFWHGKLQKQSVLEPFGTFSHRSTVTMRYVTAQEASEQKNEKKN